MPITQQDFIQLPITKATIFNALEKARTQNFHDNLRHRPPIVQLDSSIRGYIGEVSLKTWFANQNIAFSESNTMNESENMDIDFTFHGKNRDYNVEVKTSLVADIDKSWDDVLRKRDIKLIRRGTATIEELSGDLHLQIYFYGHRKKRDNFLKSLNLNLDLPSHELYDKMELKNYLGNTYFIGWIDKPTLVKQIQSKSKKTWAFGMREFWLCNLGKEAKKPLGILEYLQGL
ncbi:MAG: hypothetical protein ACJAUH_001841 [Saprospiraceae bacterium]